MIRLKGLGKTMLIIVSMLAAAIVCFVALLCIGLLGIGPLAQYWVDADTELSATTTSQHTIMYDKNGQQFAEVWTEDRKEVSGLDKISEPMQKAIVSAEDKGFYDHGAIDVVATLRSIATGSGGGSGITQQLVKNLQYYDSSSTDESKAEATATTISRKLRELKLAMAYEQKHSKDEILLEYLNTVAVGAPNVYGVETASETLFNKQAKDLTLGEAAALAGSVNNPSLYNLRNLADKSTYDRVKARQKYVLDRMLEDGYVNQREHDDAVNAQLTVNVQSRAGDCGASKYPFYCQYVMNYLQGYGALGSTPEDRAKVIANGGLEIHTALDPTMLEQLDGKIKADWGTTNPKVQASAVVQPGTGYVLAIGGNRDWGTDDSAGQTQIVLADSSTQTGSTFKMFTLAAALNAGWSEAQLDTISSACPWTKPGFETPAGGIGNSSSCALQGGHLTYRQATAYSANTWFVELESRIGVEAVKEFATSVGLTVPDSIGPSSASFTLGVTDATPIEMAAAYATFDAKGVYCPATPVTSIRRIDGQAIEPPDDWDASTVGCRAVMSPHSASVVLKAQDANVNGTDIPGRFGAKAAIAGRSTGGKSGTTTNFANLAWVQTVAQYVVFSNSYDPRGNFAYPMTGYYWRGCWNGPYAEAAAQTTRDFIATNLANVPDVPLDLNDQNDSWAKTDNTVADMITVPNVVGMSPDEALEALETIGLNSKVLKDTGSVKDEKNNSAWPVGVVSAQSVTPGTRLIVGSKKIIELTVTSERKAVSNAADDNTNSNEDTGGQSTTSGD